MKRTGLKRYTPIRRLTRLRSVNPERRNRKRAQDFGALAHYVRDLPCCVPVCRNTRSDPAHVKSRGAGGHAWTPDGRGNIAPLCRLHHMEQHAIGIRSFEAKHEISLARIAEKIGERFKSDNPNDDASA